MRPAIALAPIVFAVTASVIKHIPGAWEIPLEVFGHDVGPASETPLQFDLPRGPRLNRGPPLGELQVRKLFLSGLRQSFFRRDGWWPNHLDGVFPDWFHALFPGATIDQFEGALALAYRLEAQNLLLWSAEQG